jgi:hypothetical protein
LDPVLRLSGKKKMRVRPLSKTGTRRSASSTRRLHVVPTAEPPAPRHPAAARSDREDARLAATHRQRQGGGPDDRAQYACSCGYLFEADVSTSVTCPHCGTGQAW